MNCGNLNDEEQHTTLGYKHQAGNVIPSMVFLLDGKQFQELTPCKQSYAVFLQLFIVVLDTLKQEAYTRAQI